MFNKHVNQIINLLIKLSKLYDYLNEFSRSFRRLTCLQHNDRKVAMHLLLTEDENKHIVEDVFNVFSSI